MNDNIFRAYDIRGIYGEELNEKTAYNIGIAFGQEIKSEGYKKAIVGHDNRASSPSLSESLIKGITDEGVDVINIGLVTTPIFSYAREYFKIPSGIMITASHSPAIYNGMKIYFNETGRIYGQTIQTFKDRVREVMSALILDEVEGTVTQMDIKEAYIAMLMQKIILGPRKIKVVIDCGNGTGSIVATDIFRRIGCEVVPLFCESDPSFPNHHPDPAVESNLTALKKKVLEVHADLGLGFDGDADRVGLIDENGHMIYGDKIMVIICRDLIPRLENKKIVMDIKCTKALEDDIIKLGGQPIYSATGHSYMLSTMKKNNAVCGGELSGHIYLSDDFYGYDDGIYAGLRLTKILSNTNKPLSSLLDGLDQYYGTPEILVNVNDNIKFKVVDEVISYAKAKNYTILTIDGVRIRFDDGWALVRCSNTGPNITMRFEAKSEERLQAIKDEFETLVHSIITKYTNQ